MSRQLASAQADAESAVVFGCAGESLVGVMAHASPAATLGVLVIVGGPQYRAGSHRQFVALSRGLARAGYPVLRFDCRGMGDSSGAARSFEAIGEDIGTAIGELMSRAPGLHGVVLWGLCDGASAALLYCRASGDTRVRGLCLANPWARGAASQARVRVKHYYGQRLLQADFWRRFATGQVGLGALGDFARTVRKAGDTAADAPTDYRARMAEGWHGFGGPILLLLSERDHTAREFVEHAANDPAWHGAFERQRLTRVDVTGADHTFSERSAQATVETSTLNWLAGACRR